MPEIIANRKNWPVFAGFLFALAAMLSNIAFFANIPAQNAIPWISLVLALVAVIFLIKGMLGTFRQPRLYRSRILSSITAVFSLMLVGVSFFSFFHARALPRSAGAPQVGQKAPDFTLADTSGRPVSLDQLFEASADTQGVPPKALMLVFYRGYW
ncbi:MAG: hypothetical protein ACRD2U_08540 [Terriglobales bacterium]